MRGREQERPTAALPGDSLGYAILVAQVTEAPTGGSTGRWRNRCSSARTVAVHLRHVYRKLRINSRVELTRLVRVRGRDETDD
jgi:hypothetical protein